MGTAAHGFRESQSVSRVSQGPWPTLAAAFWFCSALIALPVLTTKWSNHVDSAQCDLLAAAAAVGAVFSWLFLLKSLLAFDPSRPVRLWSGLERGSDEIAWDVSKLPSRFSASYVVAGMGVLWAGMGGALLLATNQLTDSTSRLGYYVMAGACFTVGSFTTHGLAGHLRFSGAGAAKKADASGAGGDSSAANGWRFWQPFQGGTGFVATQALGWALYSTALVSILWMAWGALVGVASYVHSWTLAAGTLMFVAELLLAGSLSFYKGQAAVEGLSKANLGTQLRDFAVMCALYIPMHLFCVVVGLSFKLLPAAYASSLWAGVLFVYYMLTSFGEPEHTGRREWPKAQEWVGRALESALPAWLGSFEVVREAKEPFDPMKRYIFGYIHHGLYPLGAGFVHVTPSFRRLFPGLRVNTLGASVISVVLIIRDIGQWLGVRVVKRRTFVATLREGRSVMLIPGGQAEMVLTYRMFRENPEYAIYTRHKGFVRVAIEEGAHLVPFVVFGEINSLGNMRLFDWPGVQRWTYKRLGFPIPYLIAGKWGLLPLPAKTGMRFVAGEPIPPPRLEEGQQQPTQEQVDALHAQFYKAVEQLWHKHQKTYPGYERVKLVLE
ncbi:hypothetical protein N2152v2_006085 [Parachlorella kessleri]